MDTEPKAVKDLLTVAQQFKQTYAKKGPTATDIAKSDKNIHDKCMAVIDKKASKAGPSLLDKFAAMREISRVNERAVKIFGVPEKHELTGDGGEEITLRVVYDDKLKVEDSGD